MKFFKIILNFFLSKRNKLEVLWNDRLPLELRQSKQVNRPKLDDFLRKFYALISYGIVKQFCFSMVRFIMRETNPNKCCSDPELF